MHAMFYQGTSPPYQLAMGPVTVGQTFTCVGLPATYLGSGPSNPAPVPFTAASVAPTAVGVVGSSYTVSALIADPARNPNVAGSCPGDQVTLSTIGTISTAQLVQFYSAT